MLNNIGIDLFCVATHYSERYGSADNYFTSLQNTNDEDDIKNYVLYFVKNSLHSIIGNFIGQCIESVESTISNIDLGKDSEITWKNMHYIWKIYLHNIKIPPFLYTTMLKQLLLYKLNPYKFR